MTRKMLTAYYDDETGELVDAELSFRFMKESSLLQADVLKDLLGMLTATYEEAVTLTFPSCKPPTQREVKT